MLSVHDKNILLLEKFCDDFSAAFKDIENIKYVFDPGMIFDKEKGFFLSYFMIEYKCQMNSLELISTSVYQWTNFNIFDLGTHLLCDKDNNNLSYDETKNYIKLIFPEAFEINFFNSYIALDYLEIKNLSTKIKEYEVFDKFLPINEIEEKKVTKV